MDNTKVTPSLTPQPEVAPATPAAPQAPKKSNTSFIIALVAIIGVIIITAIALVLVFNNNKSSDKGQSQTSTTETNNNQNGGSDSKKDTSSDPRARVSRLQDLSRIMVQLTSYAVNNRRMPIGPAVWESEQGKNCDSDNIACYFIENYLRWQNFEDPDGVPYGMMITEDISTTSDITLDFGSTASFLTVANGVYTIGGSDPLSEHMIYVIPGSKCNSDNNGAVESTAKRAVSILYYTGDDGTFCSSND